MNFYSIEQSFLFLFLNAQQVIKNKSANKEVIFFISLNGYWILVFTIVLQIN